ncbi:MAG: insulinase family protein [Candidatus Eisenbacteria bacterium]
MIRRLARTALACLAFPALACLAPAAAGAGAGPDTLADSTWVDRWKLKNGLEVTVRHVPACNGVAVIAAYRVGRDQDPRGRAGMADLLCEVLFTAAAGDVPERSREQMDDLRPLGWNLQVAPRFSLMSEVATVGQFPGVLRQMADRMRGVTVTDSILAQARRTTVREQGEKYVGSPERTLFSQMRDLAMGVTDEDLIRRVAGRTLQDLTGKEVGDRLRRLYVPANAVLALAGNLDGVDLHALVRNLFEDIPGGTAQPEPPSPRLTAAGRAIRRPTLEQPLGGVGIIAPAITDTLHANFYLNALVVGRFCEETWGPAQPPLPLRFRYPVFADAQLVQFFPPVAPGETDADQLGVAFQDAVEKLAVTVVAKDTFDELRVNHRWLFGGELTPSLLRRIRQHSGTLHTLASTLAVRALWGSEEFWARYLARFSDPLVTGGARWTDYFESPDHVVRLLLTPAKH